MLDIRPNYSMRFSMQDVDFAAATAAC